MLSDGEYCTNPWTKENNISFDGDLCKDSQINIVVKELYEQYRPECNRFIDIYRLPVFDITTRRYYVYAWHTKTDPKKYFYVGKGTRQRYKHILKEIDDYRAGKNTSNSRYKCFSYLQEKYGIDCEIVLGDLSEYEAIIYEQSLKLHMLNNGEVLLNVEGIPSVYLPEGWQNRQVDVPMLENSLFYRRYYDYSDIPTFDLVDLSCLDKVYLYPYGSGRDVESRFEEDCIENWINGISGKIYSNGTAKGVKAIIVFRYMSEERYRVLKSLGKQIYSSLDVVENIRSTNKSKNNNRRG